MSNTVEEIEVVIESLPLTLMVFSGKGRREPGLQDYVKGWRNQEQRKKGQTYTNARGETISKYTVDDAIDNLTTYTRK